MSKFQKKLYLLVMLKLIVEGKNELELSNYQVKTTYSYVDLDKYDKFKGDNRSIAIKFTTQIFDNDGEQIYKTVFQKNTNKKLEDIHFLSLDKQLTFILNSEKYFYYKPFISPSYSDIKSVQNEYVYKDISTSDPNEEIVKEIEQSSDGLYNSFKELNQKKNNFTK